MADGLIEIVPYGFCQCGCGRPTGRSVLRHHRHFRFVQNHHAAALGKVRSIPERFWSRVQRGPGCWEWTGARDAEGRGMFKLLGEETRAPRASWVIHTGRPIPDGLHVCHHCDNPGCVRFDHLFLGTHQDNMADREAKGRGHDKRGEANGRAKLTEDQVREIRRRYAAGGVYQHELAAEYGVTQTMISYIVLRKTWREVAA